MGAEMSQKKFRCFKCFESKTKEKVIEISDHNQSFGGIKKYVCKECFKTYNKPLKVPFVIRKKKSKKKIRKTKCEW